MCDFMCVCVYGGVCVCVCEWRLEVQYFLTVYEDEWRAKVSQRLLAFVCNRLSRRHFYFFLFEWPAAFSMAAANFLILFFKSVVLTQSGLLEIIWFSRWVHENWGQHVGGGCSPATKGLFFISKVLNCANWKMREVEKVRENYLVYRLSFPILNLVEHILSY